jgi:hypothetical protein
VSDKYLELLGRELSRRSINLIPDAAEAAERFPQAWQHVNEQLAEYCESSGATVLFNRAATFGRSLLVTYTTDVGPCTEINFAAQIERAH